MTAKDLDHPVAVGVCDPDIGGPGIVRALQHAPSLSGLVGERQSQNMMVSPTVAQNVRSFLGGGGLGEAFSSGGGRMA